MLSKGRHLVKFLPTNGVYVLAGPLQPAQREDFILSVSVTLVRYGRRIKKVRRQTKVGKPLR